MISKKDFIEIEFTGKDENDKIFDTSIEKIARENKLYVEEEKDKFKPLKLCVGEHMLVNGFDEALVGKEIGKDYNVSLSPKEAFGERNSKYLKTVSVNSFRKHGMEPVAGMVVTLDNILARIAAVSGGRVIIDLNNPLAGKRVTYQFKILRKIDDDKEKIEIVIIMLLSLKAEIEIEKEAKKAKITLELKLPGNMEKGVCEKIKELTGFDSELLVKEKKEKVEEKKAEERREEKTEKEKGEKAEKNKELKDKNIKEKQKEEKQHSQ